MFIYLFLQDWLGVLCQCCGPQTISISITRSWKFVRNAESQPTAPPPTTKLLNQNLRFDRSPSDSHAHESLRPTA